MSERCVVVNAFSLHWVVAKRFLQYKLGKFIKRCSKFIIYKIRADFFVRCFSPSCHFRDPKRPWFLFALTEKGRELSEDDIDAGLVKDFLRDVGSNIRDQDLENPRQLYENMRLVRTMGHREEDGKKVKVLVPRNVAMLFFHRTPDEFFQGAITEITLYHDNEVMEDLKKTGPIDQQINETLEYILANSKTEQSPSYVQYPRKAVREAVVNAFYHRGYEPEHNDPVKVRIYSTHIDIISYPGPHQSSTITLLGRQ